MGALTVKSWPLGTHQGGGCQIPTVPDTNGLHAQGLVAFAVGKYASTCVDSMYMSHTGGDSERKSDMSRLAWPGQLTRSHTLCPNKELMWH